MTTKKFQLIHYCKDGNENYRTDHNTYNEAVTAMCNELQEEGNFMSPKDFDIVEVEVVNEEAVLMDTSSRIAKTLAIFGDKFDIVPFIHDGEGFVEMHSADQKYPSLSRYEMERIYNVMDEVSAELPEGYEVFANITHECAIRLILKTPNAESK